MGHRNLFESSRLKIERAKHHISDLDGQITAFFDKYPHEVVIEADSEPGYKVHKARLTHAIPVSLALIASDAVMNLRAALDHIGYSISLAAGVAKPTHYHFPFKPTAAEFTLRSCRALPKQIQTVFAHCQPYRDGNTLLWALNEMRNRDSHAVVMPISMANHFVHIRSNGGIEPPKNPHWDYIKNEIELFRTKRDPKYKLSLALEIGFDGPEPLHREPMIPTLDAFVGIVEDILVRVERECRFIGLV
jgi:hypothetical protein